MLKTRAEVRSRLNGKQNKLLGGYTQGWLVPNPNQRLTRRRQTISNLRRAKQDICGEQNKQEKASNPCANML